jgi:hypothetical protein
LIVRRLRQSLRNETIGPFSITRLTPASILLKTNINCPLLSSIPEHRRASVGSGKQTAIMFAAVPEHLGQTQQPREQI